MKTAQATSPSPTQPTSGRPRSRPSSGADSATRPPMASSQAREGSEKKAQGWFALVSQTENAHELTAMTPSTTTADERDGRRRHAMEAKRSTAGQIR